MHFEIVDTQSDSFHFLPLFSSVNIHTKFDSGYTRELMNEGDNPPIGIVLCADKSDAIVKYTLPENNNQIFASKYFTYLPTEDELKRELRLDDFQRVE